MHFLERGWLSSNNVLFDDGHTSWLIDSGYTTHAAQTLELVDAKLAGRPLDYLINTHLHSDHCGGNAALQREYPSVMTLIPVGQSQHVKNWDLAELTYEATGQQCQRFDFNQTMLAGEQIRLGFQHWDVYAAPGHDPDAVLLFEPQHRILISGDALWENGFGVVFPELEGEDAFSHVASTLDLIEKLQPHTVIPGHGPVFAYTEKNLAVARQRLEAFVQSPSRHARHAAKVLLKFKLLEFQQLLFGQFCEWAEKTPYLHTCQQSHFKDIDFPHFIEQMCMELVASNAARLTDGTIHNA
jgi:glyoxylase-like metal-dependent hydrolase (beta-lactamase superfamily II)